LIYACSQKHVDSIVGEEGVLLLSVFEQLVHEGVLCRHELCDPPLVINRNIRREFWLLIFSEVFIFTEGRIFDVILYYRICFPFLELTRDFGG
jgi:hypothetical protein